MSPAASAKLAMVGNPGQAKIAALPSSEGSGLAEFERIYRSNVEVVMAYFARRCQEPQTVADLTSETFVRAATGFGGFDPDRGSPRAWLFGIAAHVHARHCQQAADGRQAVARLAGHRALADEEIDELAERIDAERAGRELMQRTSSRLTEFERAAVELIDVAGLSPKEAAAVLGVSRAVLRKRLSRARARLRKEEIHG
jgi:RNA polymerase sigma factor (sigma-70 family)